MSYVKATDTSESSQLSYAISSDLFHIDEKTGSVFLIAWLEPSIDKLQRYEYVEITVTDSHNNKLSIRNRIVVLNVNNQAPELITPTSTYFELLENNNFPMDLEDKNGDPVELVFRNSFPVESEIEVTCENTAEFRDACTAFEFRRNDSITVTHRHFNSNEWFGHIRVLKKLNSLEHPLVQFVAVAKVRIT